MRILHLLSERGWSGGEHQLQALLRHLKRTGHESLLVLHPRARFRGVAEELGLEVRSCRMAGDLDLPSVLRLRGIFRRTGPDLIHLACSRSHKLGGIAGVGNPTPKVVTRRMDYPLGGSFYKRWLYASAVDAVIAVSEGVRKEILGLGVPPEKVEVIHDGVDCARLSVCRDPAFRAESRRRLGIPGECRVGITVASLHRRKGHDLLFEALRGLRVSAGMRLCWLLAGEGPERGALESLAESLPMEVRFLGRVEGIESVLAAADLFCLPSRKEGLGVALLEAMASGLPVIASKVGGMAEAFHHGESGLHVPVDDPVSLRESVEEILSRPGRARALAEEGRRRARESFDLSRMCQRTERLYEKLVSRRPE